MHLVWINPTHLTPLAATFIWVIRSMSVDILNCDGTAISSVIQDKVMTGQFLCFACKAVAVLRRVAC